MTAIVSMLERLDMSQYLQSFLQEGFDTWETLMDITESDLDALGVKLGHRRKLQRMILEARGWTGDNIHIGVRQHYSIRDKEEIYRSEEDGILFSRDTRKQTTGNSAGSGSQKRKYRRHPKVDEFAPERPPSAYVIFSNQMREQLKGQDLSFTDIAKIVGERWQVLATHEKEPCERQAHSMKEKYYLDLNEYKKTPQYAQYQEYLADFKAKHDQRTENKRSKPGPEEQLSIDTNPRNLVSRTHHTPSSSGNSYAAYRGSYRSESPESYRRANGGPTGSEGTSPRDSSPLNNFRPFPAETDREEDMLNGAGRQQILPSHVVPAYRAPPLPHSIVSRGPGSPIMTAVPYGTNTMQQSSSSRQQTLSNGWAPSQSSEHRRSSVPERPHVAALQTNTQPASFVKPDAKQGNTNRVLPVPLPLAQKPAGSAPMGTLGPVSPMPHYSQSAIGDSLGKHDMRSAKSSIAALLEAGEQLNRDAECRTESVMPGFRAAADDRLWKRGS